jgi:transcriptional regulator GlxA family with amidase domain
MFAEPDTTTERHFSVEELAELWKMSPDFVRRLFNKEPGVVVFCNPQRGKRVYRTLRIPLTVATRVHERMSRQANRM